MRNLLLFLLFINVSLLWGQEGRTPPAFKDTYPKKIGHLRLSDTKSDFGIVLNNEIRYDTIQLYNIGIFPMNISIGSKEIVHIKASLSASVLPAGGKGFLAIAYDAARKNDMGFCADRLSLATDDPSLPEKNLMISADIRPWFPPGAAEDSLRPVCKSGQSIFNYGSVKQGDKVTCDFLVENDGKKPLLLYKAQTDCPCIKVSSLKKELLPGESIKMHVEFDTTAKGGAENRIILVYTSDPLLPIVRFELNGTVIIR